jgi:NADPH:quinone reductase-like Zn-dependent oxidoreductase
MQALVLERPAEPLKFVERPDSDPSQGEVRVAFRLAVSCRRTFMWLTVNYRTRSRGRMIFSSV